MDIDNDGQISVDTVGAVDVQEVFGCAVGDIGDIHLHGQIGHINLHPAQTACIDGLKEEASESGEKAGKHGVWCTV